MAVAVALAFVGCAHDQPPAPLAPTRAHQSERVKMAILPVESDAYPRVAGGLNDVLRDVHVKGVDDYFFSKVPLEVVQLSIECVESTNECFASVGKSLTAQRLLLAQIAPGSPKKREKSLRVIITYFDVEAGVARNSAAQSFKSEGEALSALADLVAHAVAPVNGTAAAQRVAK